MKIKFLYILVIYNIFVITLKSEPPVSKDHPMEISAIDSKIELKRSQIMELENLKKAILKKKKSGERIKIGVALSGGGSKGFAHIGVLRVLEENNIPIDYISGTSMGGIVASLYAVGYNPDEIEAIVKTMDWRYRLSNDPMRMDIPLEEKFRSEKYFASVTYDDKLNFSLPKGVLTGEKSYLKLKELFWDVKDVKSFDEFKPALRIIATDFNTGKAKSFDHGDLALIVSASMAIPTIYDPVKIEDKVYIDGMVSRNLPVEDLFSAGADIVIASDVGAPQIDQLTYNLLTVVSKISTYRGTESTEKQRELATIIIDPDVKLEDATNFDNFDDLISKGELAAEKKLKELKKYENPNVEQGKRKRGDLEEVYIDDIQIENSKFLGEEMRREIVEDHLDSKIPGKVSYKELESLMMKLYAMPYIEKSYYTIDGSTLKISVDENELNFIRVGANYNSDTGAKLAVGTDLTKIGKIGRVTSLEFEAGDYKSIEFDNFWYYGEKNKVGINLSLGYEENPLYIYDERSLKAESTEAHKFIDLSLTTKLFRQFDFSAGLKYIDAENEFDVGSDEYKDILSTSYGYQEAYLKLVLDRKNSSIYPTKGTYLQARHEVGGIGSDDVEYYSELGIIQGHMSLTPKLSLNASLSGGVVSGEHIPLGNHFKIGGINNDLDNNYISFYGYNTMRKLASEFIVGQIGAQYMIYPNIYILAKINVLTYTGINENDSIKDNGNLIFEDFEQGYGITLGYKSIFGPLEISATNDADSSNSGIISVNMGYVF
ncbi:patatin-like phospholipase family protein [Psychrilyobacter atlanticus]|uniref:patatin-like phospholipase family protein n=1 Tax=Psychrilyobacter atlanticus TaxID=271091 RepID=UPI00041DEC0C|nr:patatin-like phospholipase family protein [Psychrilyobacter atlanticus]